MRTDHDWRRARQARAHNRCRGRRGGSLFPCSVRNRRRSPRNSSGSLPARGRESSPRASFQNTGSAFELAPTLSRTPNGYARHRLCSETLGTVRCALPGLTKVANSPRQPSPQVADYDIVGLHALVRDAARLNGNQSVDARNSANVPERVQHQSAPDQFEIGFEDFFSQAFESHLLHPSPFN